MNSTAASHLQLDMRSVAAADGVAHDIYSARMFADLPRRQLITDPARAFAGVYLVAARPSQDQPPVVMLADVDALGLPNEGASATNAAEMIVETWAGTLAAHFGCEPRELVWLEYDSMAQFDRIVCSAAGVRFEPLRADGSTPRSRGAFDSAYPAVAAGVMRQLVYMALTDPRHVLQPLGKPH